MHGCATVYPFTHWRTFVLTLPSYWRLQIAFLKNMCFIYGNVPCEQLIMRYLKIFINSLKIAIPNPYLFIEITYFMRNNYFFSKQKKIRRDTLFYMFANLFIVWLHRRLWILTPAFVVSVLGYHMPQVLWNLLWMLLKEWGRKSKYCLSMMMKSILTLWTPGRVSRAHSISWPTENCWVGVLDDKEVEFLRERKFTVEF